MGGATTPCHRALGDPGQSGEASRAAALRLTEAQDACDQLGVGGIGVSMRPAQTILEAGEALLFATASPTDGRTASLNSHRPGDVGDGHSLGVDPLDEQLASPRSQSGITVRHEGLLGRVAGTITILEAFDCVSTSPNAVAEYT